MTFTYDSEEKTKEFAMVGRKGLGRVAKEIINICGLHDA